MILADGDILNQIKAGVLEIEPFDESCVQPSSVDLHLGNEFLIFKRLDQTLIDTRKGVEGLMDKVEVSEDQPIVVHPREFLLGTTVEKLKIPNDLVGRLEGKSSLGRIGIIVHSTAGYLDPGFCGQVTLEISNLANLPIALYPGMKICQVSFVKMTSKATNPYGSKKIGSHYQNQTGVVESKIGI